MLKAGWATSAGIGKQADMFWYDPTYIRGQALNFDFAYIRGQALNFDFAARMAMFN